jgi:hypothetical protein
MTYAPKTEVSVEKSRAEIEKTLERFGANQFSYARDDARGMACIQFSAQDRLIRFVLKLPARDARVFTHSKQGMRTAENAYKAWEQACRARWRALALCIKAKLAAVDAQISEFEDEFLSNIVLPDGKTAGQWLRPQIEQAYLTEQMPRSFLALPAPETSSP